MRLIGNKTRLLDAIEEFLRDRGWVKGTLIDIFSGTSSVGRHFKGKGLRVIANDHLSAGYTQAVAGVEVSRYPRLTRFRRAHREIIASREFRESFPGEPEFEFLSPRRGKKNSPRDPSLPLRQANHFLNHFVTPEKGLIFRNYCPGGSGARMYFKDEHGQKIDGILSFLRNAQQEEVLDRGELHLLLASLLDAADRVANISGTYGAYLKNWQPNTRREIRLEPFNVVESSQRNEAHQADANQLIRKIHGDVLYIDPPYNHRQYAANYHLLEIMAEHHRIRDLEAYERGLYGKTGLRPYKDLRSLYCVRPGRRGAGGNALTAMTDLILSTHARCVVVSYNEEGLLSREEIGAILARFSGVRSFDFRENLREINFPRFRSDSDRPPGTGRVSRAYRVVDGKEQDRVGELLFFARRDGPGRKKSGRRRQERLQWS